MAYYGRVNHAASSAKKISVQDEKAKFFQSVLILEKWKPFHLVST